MIRARPLPAAMLFIGLAAVLPSDAAMDRAALVQLGGSVLKIEVLRGESGFSLGSGVVIDNDMVVTNCHVTREAQQISVLRGDSRWRVKSQIADTEHDLCVLRVPGLQSTVAALGSASALRPHQSVTALGYTGGIELSVSGGEVIALHRLDGSAVIQSSNSFNSGASGGGLFDDSGRLVGILTFRLRGTAAHYFAAPVDWLKPMMNGQIADTPVAPLDAKKLAYWQRPPTFQPDFLQVAVLERERRWNDLQALAAHWAETDAADAEAWYMQGLALSQLDRLADALAALEKSVALEPASSAAWFRLGEVCVRLNRLDRAREASAQLADLDPALSDELKQLIDKAKG